MLDIGWSEMAVVMVVALLVIGPKDLPRVARSIGKWTAKARSMAREFQRSLDDMAREAELEDIKSEIDKVSRTNIGQTIRETVDPSGDLEGAFQVSPHMAPERPERRVTPAAGAAAATAGQQPAQLPAQPGTPAAAPAAENRPAEPVESRPAAPATPAPQAAPAPAAPAPAAAEPGSPDNDAARKS